MSATVLDKPKSLPPDAPNAKLLKWAAENPEAEQRRRERVSEVQKARFDIVAECRKYAPEAIRALVEALRSEGARIRIEAASILLDRGFGKAAQLVEYQGEVEFRLGALDDETLEGLIRDRFKGLGLSKPRSAPALSPQQEETPKPVIIPIITPSED